LISSTLNYHLICCKSHSRQNKLNQGISELISLQGNALAVVSMSSLGYANEPVTFGTPHLKEPTHFAKLQKLLVFKKDFS
jgi:hypothetical protein